MTDLAWVIALLSPRDIAVHPNFRSQEVLTAPSLFGLLVMAQSGRFNQARTSDDVPDLLESDPTGMSAVDAMRAATDVESVAAGAEMLADIATLGPAGRPAMRVACAVAASSCYAELDRVSDSMRVLEATAMAPLGSDQNVEALLRSILSVNLALRARDVGDDSIQSARVASENLAAVDVDQLPAVQLSRSASWDSNLSLTNIVAILEEACASHLADSDREFGARLDLVRRRPATISLRRQARAGAAMDKFLKKAFDEVVGAGANTWSIGGTDGDEELVESLCIAEFSGSPTAAYQRTLLGTFRLLEGRSNGQKWQIREGIRLLRHGHSKQRLEPALRLIRREGPLDVLQAEAIQILQNRTGSTHIGDLEATVLGAGSDVVGPQTAAEGVRRLLSMRLEPLGKRAGRWQQPSRWYESTVRAAQRLASSAKLEEQVLTALLGDLESEQISDDYDHIIGRLLNGFDLSIWSKPFAQDAARACLARSTDSLKESTAAIERQLAMSAPIDQVMPPPELPLTLMRLASVVDRSLVTSAPFPADLLDPAKDLVLSHMQETRVSAANGQFSGRSVAESDIAVALMFLTGDQSLWPPLVDLLCDPRVGRSDKTRALNRIVRSPEKVPSSAREALRSRAQNLLVGGPAFMESSVDPYPSAVALCAVLDLVPSHQLLSMLGSLLGSSTTYIRSEGVQVLSAMARANVSQPWLATSALLLSYDEDTSLRASAGFTLCLLHDTSQIGPATVEDRVIALLGSEGTEVPISVLSGIQQAKWHASPRLKKVLSAMAASHISRDVRSNSRQCLSELD